MYRMARRKRLHIISTAAEDHEHEETQEETQGEHPTEVDEENSQEEGEFNDPQSPQPVLSTNGEGLFTMIISISFFLFKSCILRRIIRVYVWINFEYKQVIIDLFSK